MAAQIHLSQQHSCSFDHLVGDGKQPCGKFDPECPGGLEVDHEPQLGGALYRQVGRTCALQNLPGVDADLSKCIRDARSVVHETADRRKFAPWIDRRDFVACRQSDDLIAVIAKQRINTNLECVNPVSYKGCESVLYF